MAFEEPFWVGITSAVAGAVLGAVATRWLERKHQRRDRLEAKVDDLAEKVHELETRIALMGRDIRLMLAAGKETKHAREAPDADD